MVVAAYTIKCATTLPSEWVGGGLGLLLLPNTPTTGSHLAPGFSAVLSGRRLVVPQAGLTTTPCGHSFCHRCLAKALESRYTCPLCRFDFEEYPRVSPNVLLVGLIEKYWPQEVWVSVRKWGISKVGGDPAPSRGSCHPRRTAPNQAPSPPLPG